MRSSPASIVGILERISIVGVLRTNNRYASTAARAVATAARRGPHGEKIFVFNHIEDGMIIYSHTPRLERDSHKALSQIPFTVKKQKPPVIRPDYWRPLCMIDFGRGQAALGLSVFQKLKELRQLHELSWGWQTQEFQKLSRRERGKRILNQKPNAVADIAAVLGGFGRANRMWTTDPEPVVENAAVEAAKEAEATAQAQAGEAGGTTSKAAASEEAAGVAAPDGPQKRLHKVTIYWSNDLDMSWAKEWTDNVDHQIGLPDGVTVWKWETKTILRDPAEADTAEETKNGESDSKAKRLASADEGAVEERRESQPQQKKGWLSWLGGKSSGSSQDART